MVEENGGIGGRLQQARDRTGLSLRRFVDALEGRISEVPTHATVNHYELGRAIPRGDYLVAVCELCGVHPVWLLFGSGPMEWDREHEDRETKWQALTYLSGMLATLEADLTRETPLIQDMDPDSYEPVPENGDRDRKAS